MEIVIESLCSLLILYILYNIFYTNIHIKYQKYKCQELSVINMYHLFNVITVLIGKCAAKIFP